jgi:signal transduction histidine kinase
MSFAQDSHVTVQATEAVLRRREQELASLLLMQAPLAAGLLMGASHVVSLANPLYCKTFGGHNVIGKRYADAFAESADEGLFTILDSVFLSGQAFTSEEYRIELNRPGFAHERFLKLNVEPLKDPDGSTYGVMIAAVDITEQVKGRIVLEHAQAERQRLLEELESTSETKDAFLATLGHELRSPLAPIVTTLALMEKYPGSIGTKEVSLLKRQVQHLTRLVDDLLDVSKVAQGKIELFKEPFEISQAVTAAVEMIGSLFEERQHQLSVEVASTGLRWTGDKTRLTQVVANLLTNAARYTHPGGEVHLTASREGDHIVIRVRDNGIGIAPEKLPRIFDLFFQGKRAAARAEGGLGIGLALVKSLVELHGGSVAALSGGPACGSEFVVRLPA